MSEKARPSYNRSFEAVRIVLLLISLLASSFLLVKSAQRNQSFSHVLGMVINQPPEYDKALSLLNTYITEDCRVYGQIALITLRTEDQPVSDEILKNMLDCTSAMADWLMTIAPEREDLALRAAELYSQEPKIWLWLGDLAQKSGDLILADKYFSESARLDPMDGLAWCRLRRVKEQQGMVQDAFNASVQCCRNGDPGSNGCYHAGRIAELMGDIPTAIRYYRLSHWQRSLDRADELEESR